MPHVTYVLASGERKRIRAVSRDTIMHVAIDNNIQGILAECGGACACGTCHVYIDTADLARVPPPESMELEILEAVTADRRSGSRLSCQIKLSDALDELTVHVPDRQI